MADEQPRYLKPKKSSNLFHASVQGLTNLGVSIMGSRVLYVRGRKTGEWRTTPVNLLVFEGERYLVAPRGHTQWVRNLRAAGEGKLRVGRRVERFTAVELPDEDKPPLLRAYLKRWAWEVSMFFENLKADSPEEDLRRAAPGFPVFRVVAAHGKP
ncbi:nitroreductase family deazaflavin-dependent oxidoreductase [Qaidamihabitans albus]|uniref:nitroreductase family deazaflavin-dependent oxidoreductase n=1 Tax=Qaidamihabitans albus TaxID=2795733 RepID=UPI0018F16E17|nr:nitroreductase family deazaflavin-dependent oxidoreductase [Qaidamihabitans albus]